MCREPNDCSDTGVLPGSFAPTQDHTGRRRLPISVFCNAGLKESSLRDDKSSPLWNIRRSKIDASQRPHFW